MNSRSKNGFTLVELIATIALLAIVSSVSFVSINGILDKRKTDECQMLVNNIKSAAKEYISDNRYGSLVGSSSDMKVNFNVSLLSDNEYLNGDVVDPYTSETIDLDRMKIHASLKDDYTVDWIDVVYDDSLYDCGDTIVAENDDDAPVMMVSVNNGTTYSKSKSATITLQDEGSGLKAGTYQLKYGWGTSQPNCSSLSDSISLTVDDNAYEVSKSVTVSGYTGNGKLYVCNVSNVKDVLGNTLSANTTVSRDMYLDNTGPVITLNNDNVSLTDDGILVPISISDSHSGFDKNSFVLSDITVKKGGTTLSSGYTLTNTNGNNYDLVISDYKNASNIEVNIGASKILDILGNGNTNSTLSVDNSKFTYTIKYIGNGSTSGSMSDTSCIYGSNCSVKSNSYVRDGYTFDGWTTKSDGTDDGYGWTGWNNAWSYENGERGISNHTLTLYARWKRNTVTIKYSVNGGTITASTGSNTWSTSSDIIYMNGSLLTTKIYYDEKIGGSGLPNYNNLDYLNVTKSNKAASPSAEWKCLSGCTTSDKTFNHDIATYKSSDFCNAKTSSCEVTIGVNWINAYTITYNANGGSGAPDSHFGAIGGNVTLSNVIPTRVVKNACNSHDNFIFLGWSTSSSATSASYYAGGTYSQANNNNVTLYAVWEKDSVRFKVENKKVQVFQLPNCNIAGVCNYDRINHVTTSGTINKSDTYTKKGVNGLGIAKTLNMANQSTNCYCSPSTTSTVKNIFPWCEDWMNDNNGDMDPNYITVWDSNVSGWYYSRTYDCFIETSKLVSSIKSANSTACPKE